MDNFNWKNLSREQLNWIYQDFDFGKNIDPYTHQLVCMAFSANENRIAYWVDVGCGKTLTSLWTARQWNCKKLLVICPRCAMGSWIRDAKQEGKTYQIISGETFERREKINQDQDISIVQYESLKTIWCNFVSKQEWKLIAKDVAEQAAQKFYEEDKTRRIEKNKYDSTKYSVYQNVEFKKWELDTSLFTQNFDCLIIDEIHRCNNVGALQSEICLELSKRVKNLVALSGTPVDKYLYELFNIYKVVDLGKTFGWNFFSFRKHYFRKSGYDYVVKKSTKDELLQRWAKSSISFDRSECFDLPDCTEDVISLPATKEFLDLEEKVIKGFDIKGNNFNLPSVKVLKLKQLTNGFIYYKGKTGEQESLRLKENVKLEATLGVMDSKEKTIIFYEHEEVGLILEEAFNKNKIKHVWMRGGLTPEESVQLENEFQKDPECLAAIVQITAGSEGWDGFSAKIMIFWDIIPSPRVRKQCIGRMVRSGQKGKTLVLELVIQGSINELTKLNQGLRKTEVEEYMDYIQKRGV